MNSVRGRRAAAVGRREAAFMAVSWFLLALLTIPSDSRAASDAWSYREAEAKVGTPVTCLSNPHERLLQWGPRFPGRDRSRQPKAVGRPVPPGAKGTVKEILQVGKGRYRVVVHWNPEEGRDLFWTTVIGPAEYNLTVFPESALQLVGNWREVDRTAAIEFRKDGGFKAVDNEGMAVAGRYAVIREGSIRFEIHHEGSADEIVTLNFSLIGDDLTLTRTGGNDDVEHYRREK